jgi:O-antigen/teichoic acid export membrane protein
MADRSVEVVKRLPHSFAAVGEVLSSRRGSHFRRNAIKVAKANIIAQLVSLAVAPLLARLYAPADFGTVAVFASLVGLLGAVSTWRFEWSVPTSTSRTQAAALMALSLLVLLFFGGMSYFVLWAFPEWFAWWEGFAQLQPYIVLLPLALVGTGLHQIMQAWFVRERDLSAVSKTKITRSLSGAFLSLVGGLLSAGATGLILSSVVSAWIGLGVLVRSAKSLGASVRKLTLRRIGAAWSRYWRESCLSTSVSLLTGAGAAATPLLLAHHYSTTAVGWYALMFRLAVAPVGLIAGAIGQSFLSEAATLAKTNPIALRILYVRTARRLALIALPLAGVCLLGPVFVGPLFGEEWTDAGFVLMALTPSVAGATIVQPITHLVVHHKQHWKLSIDAANLLGTLVILLTAGQWARDLAEAVLAVSLVNASAYLALYRANLRCLAN